MGRKVILRKKSVRKLSNERRLVAKGKVYEVTGELVPKFLGVYDGLRISGTDPRAAALSALMVCFNWSNRDAWGLRGGNA